MIEQHQRHCKGITSCFHRLLLLIVLVVFKCESRCKEGRRSFGDHFFGAWPFQRTGFGEADRPALLTKALTAIYCENLGMYNYTIYDAVQSTKASAQGFGGQRRHH